MALLSVPTGHAADPFAENVRTTEPLAPDLEQKSFHLPAGFEIQLVAAEPDLRKPMNMAFDAAGRLWITESREYPIFAKPGQPMRDTIRIFSDFDPAGRARKVTTFATNLNIPIGIYPFLSPRSSRGNEAPSEGRRQKAEGRTENQSRLTSAATNLTWKCIAWSIPNIWLFEDTDGDGVADKQEVLYGPFDHTRDTHGNQASFRRGFDGWLYATHGFNNRSRVAGRDGHEVVMNSGNTYRMKLDGSRIEHWTYGQVNPFGLTFDPLGNLYSADCHSSPIYQLLRGAYYPSFGAPDDGLGFAPVTIQHSHGSTAIGGIVYISDPLWPAEFQNNIFVGNVMTSRINRDQIAFLGSSSKGKEMPDFLSTDDPWFRPVDLQIGPDGALWVADFYNRIIGHYEVPLSHPGRDRERGRLWRIVPPRGADLAKLKLDGQSVDSLLNEIVTGNGTRQRLARESIINRFGTNAVSSLANAARGQWHFRAGMDRTALMTSALWMMQQLGRLDEATLLGALQDRDAGVRTHAMRVLTERGLQTAAMSERAEPGKPRSGINAALRSAAVTALEDSSAAVQRAAADALGANPTVENIPPLIALLSRVPASDSHLRHVTRMALRACLAVSKEFASLAMDEKTSRALADIAPSLTNSAAGSFLVAHLQKYSEPRDRTAAYLKHAARFVPEQDLDSLASFTRQKFGDDVDLQLALFKSVQDGTAQRGAKLSRGARDWGAELAAKLLAPAESEAAWVNTPLDGAADTRSPWALQERSCADGQKVQLMASFPNGEPLTGSLRSQPFALPPRLRFYLAGHDGFPDKPAQKKNVVHLKDAVTHAVLREAWPPRNDTAQRISWDLSEFSGKRGYVEVTDADTGSAYAWLAFGRFDPALPQLALGNNVSARLQAAADIARSLQLASLEPDLTTLLLQSTADVEARASSARALAAFYPAGSARDSSPAVSTMARVLNNAAEPVALREKVAAALGEVLSPAAGQTLVTAMQAAPSRLQAKLAAALASTAGGAEALLRAIAEGKASPRLLQERAVKDRLSASKPADLDARVLKLTKGLAPANETLQKLIDQRSKGFAPAKASAAKGADLFVKNCAVCHQIGGKGALIGPQLDGIGNRGLDRLCEDVLDPNRSVDVAFRSSLLTMKDGDVLSGLFRREEGEMVVLAESTGKEISVPKKQIADRRESETSLMPENFGELLAPGDFNDLMAYLLSQAGKPAGQ